MGGNKSVCSKGRIHLILICSLILVGLPAEWNASHAQNDEAGTQLVDSYTASPGSGLVPPAGNKIPPSVTLQRGAAVGTQVGTQVGSKVESQVGAKVESKVMTVQGTQVATRQLEIREPEAMERTDYILGEWEKDILLLDVIIEEID